MTDQLPLDLDPIRARLRRGAGNDPWHLLGGGEWISPIGVAVSPDDGGVSPAEADLIVNAPTDLAALVAEVDRLRAALVEIRDTRILGAPMARTLDRIILVARKAIGGAA